MYSAVGRGCESHHPSSWMLPEDRETAKEKGLGQCLAQHVGVGTRLLFRAGEPQAWRLGEVGDCERLMGSGSTDPASSGVPATAHALTPCCFF